MNKFSKLISEYDFSELKKIFDKCGNKTKIFEYFNVSDNSQNCKVLNELFKHNEYSFPHKNKRYCLNCGKELKKGQVKFCCLSCSATYNNKLRGCLSEETKQHISESLNKRNKLLNVNKNKIKVCKFCGEEHCQKNDACSHHSIKWIEQLECFGFDLSTIGSIGVNKEYNKIKELLYKEYYDNSLSIRQIKEKYNYPYSVERLVHVLKRFGIILRTLSEAQINGLLNGNINHNVFSSNIYKCGWYENWQGKKFFLRSSYEFDFAKKLDEEKIEYYVEWRRIKYWDSQTNTYRVAIPDFYVPSTNTIYEIKSIYTYDETNMTDKFNEYKKLGFNTVLVLEHKEIYK